MASQWDNFLRNLGEWRGSFTGISADGLLLESTPSILTLEQGAEERLVHFRLRRFAGGDLNGEPSRDMQQDYRSLGRQVVFFETGTFCKGSLQVAPGTAFGGEFGFVCGDRRHRLVQLHDSQGQFEQLVLIREFSAGSGASEQPPLEPAQLAGEWRGEAATVTADWPEPSREPCQLQVTAADGSLSLRTQIGGQEEHWSVQGSGPVLSGDADPALRLTLLPDGGFNLSPQLVSHRSAFAIEAGWLATPDRLERLIRRYDRSGAWLSATQIIASRV